MPRDLYGKWIKTDMFGRRISKKDLNREKMDEIRRKGKAGEDAVKMKYTFQGYEVEKTGRGSDIRIRRRDMFNGRVVQSKVIEVKTGKSQLSKFQRKTKARMGSNYKVERVEPLFY